MKYVKHWALTKDVDVAVGEGISVLIASVTLDHHQIALAGRALCWCTVVLAQVDYGHRQAIIAPAKLVRWWVVSCTTNPPDQSSSCNSVYYSRPILHKSSASSTATVLLLHSLLWIINSQLKKLRCLSGAQWRRQNFSAAGAQPGHQNLDWDIFNKLNVPSLFLVEASCYTVKTNDSTNGRKIVFCVRKWCVSTNDQRRQPSNLAACQVFYSAYDWARFHSETNGQWQADSHTSDTGCLRHHRH